MSMVLGIAIGIVFIFIIVSLMKKIMKFVIWGSVILMVLSVGGYFFLFGDGQISQEYLPEQAHENFQNIRNDARNKVETKASELKEQAIEKASSTTQKATENIKSKVQEGVQQGVDAAINNIKKGPSEEKEQEEVGVEDKKEKSDKK